MLPECMSPLLREALLLCPPVVWPCLPCRLLPWWPVLWTSLVCRARLPGMCVGMGVCLCVGRACWLSLVWVAPLTLWMEFWPNPLRPHLAACRVFVLLVLRLFPLRGGLTNRLLPLGMVP